MPKPDATGLLADMMRRRDRLFPLIYQFNLLPSRYIHSDWAETMFAPGLWQRLTEKPRCEPALSRLILETIGLAGTFPVDFSTSAARMALLDRTALQRLALHLGLTVEGALVRRVVRRHEVLALREALGEAAYAFAVQRAPLLAAGLPVAEGDVDAPEPEEVRERALAAGWRLIAAAAAGLPPEQHRRFALKLPRRAAEGGALSDVMDRLLAAVARIVRETEPRWASLFVPATA